MDVRNTERRVMAAGESPVEKRSSRSSRSTYVAALISALLLTICATSAVAGNDKLEFVFFGDSLSDTGNRFLDEGSINTPPYDIAASENLIPSFPYAIGGPTFSNGAVWAEHFARSLGRGGSSQAALRSNGIASNYAYGGARASNAPPIDPNDNRHLTEQVNLYLADVNDEPFEEAYHVIFIGGNDIGEALQILQSEPGDATQIIANAVESVVLNVQRLAGYGAQRFLIVTAPNPGYIPPAGTPEAIFFGGLLTTAFNCPIAGTSASRPVCPPLPSSLPAPLVQLLQLGGADVRVLDGQTLFDQINNTPEQFGLANTTMPCIRPFQPPFQCKNPDEYVYWDNTHPTARVHEIIAEEAVQLFGP